MQHSSLNLAGILDNDQSSPSQRFANIEQLRRLANAMLALPADQRQAVELRYLHELPIAEIAERMTRSVASVGGLLQRALKGLRKEMGGEIT